MNNFTLGLIVCLSVGASTVAYSQCRDGETWIDPGNDARVVDYIGQPGGKVSVAYVDAVTRKAVCTQIWRDADPGGHKELDTHCGGRTLDTKGLRYSVFVRNTTTRSICAWPSSPDQVKTLNAGGSF